MAGDRLLDAPHVDDVGTDPQDHASPRARPRVMAARIFLTTVSKPS
jgi:hypothetical protein